MTDYYEILEVSREATKEEIKSAFRKKARLLHPDVNKSPDAEEKFKELGKAYETLIDDNKRATYDRFGEDGLRNAGFDSQGPFAGGFGDLNDILSSFFENFGFSTQARHDPNAPQQGDDLRLDIELEFEEAVFGTKKEIKIDHLETCKECGGTGAKAGTTPITCPTCNGSGKVQHVTQTILGHMTQIGTCPECKGTGRKIESPCPLCKALGLKNVEKKIELNIPPGVDDMSKMRLSNEGDAGRNNGPAGDLYVVLHVKQSDYFHRDGINVITELQITPAQAVLGDTITIKTLNGEGKVQIPPATQSGNTIRLQGAGIPHVSKPSHRGDHIVVATVKTPTKLSDEEKNLYKQLFELNTGKKPSESIVEKVKGVFN